MLLTQILSILTWCVWTSFFAAVGLSLWRTARTRGLGAALRQLRGPIALQDLPGGAAKEKIDPA